MKKYWWIYWCFYLLSRMKINKSEYNFSVNTIITLATTMKTKQNKITKSTWIKVITKLPTTEQSSKWKGKTHQSTDRQNQSTTGKLGKLQWPWLGTGISKEMVGWIRFYGAKPPASIAVKGFRLSLWHNFNNTGTK